MKHIQWLKKATMILTACALITGCLTAYADGVPASQFNFHGWPYRQNTSCGTQRPDAATPCPTPAVEATSAPTQTERPTEPVIPTSAPTMAPTVAPTAAPTATPAGSESHYTMISISAQEQTAWNLLNEDRAAGGLSALPLDAALSALARKKSEDMRNNHYFAHTSPTLGSAADMLMSAGYAFISVGENIAHHATVVKAQAAFMSSTGHRQNIMGSQWTRVGVGVCYDENGYVYVTQLFAR